MKRKINKNLVSVILMLSIVIPLLLLVIIGVTTDKLFYDHENDEIKLTWYLENNKDITIIDFPKKIECDKNQEITIYTYLPNDSSKLETIFYRSMYQKVVIKLDSDIIYVYDTSDSRLFGLSNPSKLNIVDLPNNIGGKRISITIECPYQRYSGYFSDLQIGTNITILNNIYGSYSFGFIFSLLIIILDLCFIIINLLFFKAKVNSQNMGLMFLSGIFVGLWLLGDSKLVSQYLNNFFVIQMMYVSLTCFILSFSLYLRKISIPKFKSIFNIFILIAVLNITIQGVFYLTNVSDYIILYPINLLIILGQLIMYFINSLMICLNRKRKGNSISNELVEISVVSAFLLITLANIVMRAVSLININVLIGFFFLLLVVVVYAKSIKRLIDYAADSKQYKTMLKETQNYLMQSQMKPHFIFNTLGAIRTLIISSPNTAYEMTTNFSKYLRANIKNIEPGEQISFAQELDHIRAYVAIEQERFRDRLKVEYNIGCEDFNIPPLSIEPLVENAVKHGVCKRVKGGTVKISSKEFDDKYVVTVEDDGVGFDVNILESEEKNKSVGLRYIILRLKELSDADFKIESEKGKGTIATITVKKREE